MGNLVNKVYIFLTEKKENLLKSAKLKQPSLERVQKIVKTKYACLQDNNNEL